MMTSRVLQTANVSPVSVSPFTVREGLLTDATALYFWNIFEVTDSLKDKK